jgi:hypothetical protein
VIFIPAWRIQPEEIRGGLRWPPGDGLDAILIVGRLGQCWGSNNTTQSPALDLQLLSSVFLARRGREEQAAPVSSEAY